MANNIDLFVNNQLILPFIILVDLQLISVTIWGFFPDRTSYNHCHCCCWGNFNTSIKEEKNLSSLKKRWCIRRNVQRPQGKLFCCPQNNLYIKNIIKMSTNNVSPFAILSLLDMGDEVYDDVDASDFPPPPVEIR